MKRLTIAMAMAMATTKFSDGDGDGDGKVIHSGEKIVSRSRKRVDRLRGLPANV